MSTAIPTSVPRPGRADASPVVDEALFRLLVEEGPEVLFLLDLENERSIYVSPAVQQLLGRDPGELVGRRLTDFVHAEDAPELLARSLRRREGRGVRTAVNRMSHADGRWIWVDATASPTLEYEGRFVCVFGVSAAPERAPGQFGLRPAKTRFGRLFGRLRHGGRLHETRDGTYDRTVEALAAALELRDDETCQHARRVTRLALELTAAIDPRLAANPELRHAYLLHDIGKIGIPDEILLKPGPLNERELRTLQMHTTLGEHLLSYIPFLTQHAQDVVAYHHEHWDGNGYPWGLRGLEIPLTARIFAVVDAFDAITSARPYREAQSLDHAIEELQRSAGSQFDPGVVEAFLPIARAQSPRSASPLPR